MNAQTSHKSFATYKRRRKFKVEFDYILRDIRFWFRSMLGEQVVKRFN